MKKSIILGMAISALSLHALTSFAAADEKYPAANFEPKVTFIDESLAQSWSSSSASPAYDEKYPAANFQPKVTYIDENAAGASSSDGSAMDGRAEANFDPKYPAAYFSPKIIYP